MNLNLRKLWMLYFAYVIGAGMCVSCGKFEPIPIHSSIKKSECLDCGPAEIPQPIPQPGIVGTTQRDGDTIGLPAASVSNFRGFDVAFDRANKVFLVVHGQGPVGGIYLDDDGKPLGTGFHIASGAGHSQHPRVGCSMDGVCLVAWHGGDSKPRVYGRLLNFKEYPQFSSSDFYIGGSGSFHESPPSISYSPELKEFLVTWCQTETYGQRVSLAGALLGGPIMISPSGSFTEQSNVTYNPVDRSFNVISMVAQGEKGAIGFRKLTAGSGQLSNFILLDEALSFTKITDIEYDINHQKVFAAWFFGGGFRGRYINNDGSFDGSAMNIFSPFASYDGFDMSYNVSTKTMFAVFHGMSAEAWGAEIDKDFHQGDAFQVTASGAKNGVHNPRILAHPLKPFWIVVSAKDFSQLIVQKISRKP